MGATMGKNGNFLDALPSQGTMHVVMLGLDSAGKTTALYRLKFDQYLNTVPTIGFNCEKIQGTLGKAKGIQFLVWDVGGQEKLRPLWRSYTRCTDGILFVVDSVDIERMEEAKMELMRTAKCPDNQGVPVLILANKQDLPSARDPKELEKLLGLHELQQPVFNFSAMGSSSSSTGNIVGSSNSNQTACSSKYGRCLTPNSHLQSPLDYNCSGNVDDSNFSAVSGIKCDSDLVTLSSSTSFLAQNSCESNEFKVIQKSHKKTNVIGCASLTTSPTTMSIPVVSDTFIPSITNTKICNNTQVPATTAHFKGWYIQPACAITGEGLQEGLEALYDMILKRRKLNKAYKKRR